MFELVGIQSVDFKDKDGNAVRGTKVYFVCDPDPDVKARGFLGQKADSHFFREGSNLPSSMTCGKFYDFIVSYTGGRYPKVLGMREVKA